LGCLSAFGLFGMGPAQKEAPPAAKVAEAELVTGTIAPRRETAPPQALAPEAAFSLPARPEPQPSRANVSATPKPACKNPNALGVSRTVEIDTGGGPGF